MTLNFAPDDQFYVSDEERAEILRKRESDKKQKDREEQDLKYVLGDARTRRFVYRLLEQSGIYRCSINPTRPDALSTAFNEGQRNIGLWLISEILSVDPALLSQIELEAYSAKIQKGD